MVSLIISNKGETRNISPTLAGFFVYRHLGLLGCNIVLMKRFLPLLMLTGLLFGQDVLTHKSGKIYKGKYYGIVEQNIVFYVEGETGNKMFPIWEVTSIELEATEEYQKKLIIIEDGKNSLTITENQINGVILFGSCVIAIAIILYLTPITHGLTIH